MIIYVHGFDSSGQGGKGDNVALVGSSLGAYYSIYLANKYKLKAVLINPAIYSYKTLDKIGIAVNYYDGFFFEVTIEHINFLKTLNFLFLFWNENFI